VVSQLPPSTVVRMITHAANKDAEELARPLWYVNMLAHAMNPQIKVIDLKDMLTKKETKPLRSGDEIAAELLPLADRR
jgi:hypothetical protein